MNRLTTQDRVRILTVLSESMGVNEACRVTGASKNTVPEAVSECGASLLRVPRSSDSRLEADQCAG